MAPTRQVVVTVVEQCSIIAARALAGSEEDACPHEGEARKIEAKKRGRYLFMKPVWTFSFTQALPFGGMLWRS
ncbi:hypothetical protein GCM10027287_19570 [Bordetella muralis]